MSRKPKPSLPRDPRPPDDRKKATRRFLGIFLALVTVYYSLTLFPWVDAHCLYPVMEASAQGASAMLHLVGVKTTVEGVVVRGPFYAVAVRRGCDPLDPMVLFSAGVIAFPTRWGRKLPGLAAGGAFLFGLNLVRLVSLYLLGANQSPWLDSIHLWWWPAIFIVGSLMLWVLWLEWIERTGTGSAAGAAANVLEKKATAPAKAGRA